MAIKKSKKSSRSPDDEETLRSDVASFASSLGLASSVPSAGFDDSDFRKKGSMKSSKPLKNPTVSPPTTKSPATSNAAKPKKSPFDNMDPLGDKTGSNSKQPKLPLVSPMVLSAQWYVDADDLEMKVLGKERGSVKALGMVELTGLVAKKKDLAGQLLQQYTQEYHFGRKKNRDLVMVENAVRSGTTADKVSALTCLVEDNPIANLKAFDTLLHMVTTKVGKRYAFSSFDALKELFLMRLLPDRKLKTLLQRPLDILPESEDGFSLLLFWYWEENLKKRYEQFVIALEDASKDMLPSLKDRALKISGTNMDTSTSKELLEFENQNHSSINDQSNLLICKNNSLMQRRQGKRLAKDLIDGGNILERPNITSVPKSGVLGKVKDFLGVINEANKKLQVGGNPLHSSYDIKSIPVSGLENIRVSDSSIDIDDNAADNESEEYIEMDLFLGVADLQTPEAVAAAETAIGSPMLSVDSTDIVEKEEKKSNLASNGKPKKTPKIIVLD